MDEFTKRAEARAEKFDNVDLRGILRKAFVIEDGLNDFLHKHCGCAFGEYNGMFAIISTRKETDGMLLEKNTDFETVLHVAFSRYEKP